MSDFEYNKAVQVIEKINGRIAELERDNRKVINTGMYARIEMLKNVLVKTLYLQKVHNNLTHQWKRWVNTMRSGVVEKSSMRLYMELRANCHYMRCLKNRLKAKSIVYYLFIEIEDN